MISKLMALLLAMPFVALQPAMAQLRVDITSGTEAPMPIAVPAFPTGASAPTPAGTTAELGQQVAGIISGNLQGSGLFRPLGAGAFPAPGMADVQRPQFGAFRTAAAQALASAVTGSWPGAATRTAQRPERAQVCSNVASVMAMRCVLPECSNTVCVARS